MIEIVTCAGGARWEAPLVAGLQRRDYGISVLRRCVDHGELLGVSLRDRPRAAIVAAELPWLDRELVGTLFETGVAVIGVFTSAEGELALERAGVAFRLPAPVSAESLSSVLGRLGDEAAPSLHSPAAAIDSTAPKGEIVAVWGGSGSPGRTTVAVHYAIEAARQGHTTILIDGDVWGASIAQYLSLDESPSITKAARLAADGWPEKLDTCLQAGPEGLAILPGLPRADLWPEVRERSWREVLDAARSQADLVVVDCAAPIEEDEELSFDRVPYRRNLVTRITLEEAHNVLLVAAADPVGMRRAVFAHRSLLDALPAVARRCSPILNRVPSSARRLQECSTELKRWTGLDAAGILPIESAFEKVAWEGRALSSVAPKSKWLRELRATQLTPMRVAS